jgi:FkbM family methyltransferase
MEYNFIEIGTSNFETIIQQCSNESKGLSIDPVKEYLNDLPDKPNVKKLNYAISNQDRLGKVFHIKKDTIKNFCKDRGLNFKMYAYIQGCNSIDKAHPAQLKLVDKFNLHNGFISESDIKILSFESLIEEQKIDSCDLIKIDAEGHDATILKSYLSALDKKNTKPAKKIIFEINPLSDKEDCLSVIDSFRKIGYKSSGTWGNVSLIL